MNLARRLRDPSLLFLLFANIVTIICAVVFNWGLMNVLWLYWFQSIIIGFFTMLKIFNAKIVGRGKIELDVELNGKKFSDFEKSLGELVGAKSSSGSEIGLFTKAALGIFFCISYGIFHLIYAMFLLFFFQMFNIFGTGVAIQQANFLGILPIVGLFFVTHAFSYYYNYILENEREMSPRGLQRLVSGTFNRIIPMHLTIIAGGWLMSFSGGFFEAVLLVFFLALKTIMDLAMHSREHRRLKLPLKASAT